MTNHNPTKSSTKQAAAEPLAERILDTAVRLAEAALPCLTPAVRQDMRHKQEQDWSLYRLKQFTHNERY